jgi:putative transposase
LTEHYYSKGISKLKIFELLGVNSTTYYNWFKKKTEDARTQSPLRLKPDEKNKIVELKKYRPEYGCSRISGQLRFDNVFVSPTTCYNYLKTEGLICALNNRPPPSREPKYLAYRPNQIWGTDWSYIRIHNERWNITAVIDTFSKYLLGFSVTRTVNGKTIRNLLSLVFMDQNIDIDDAPILSMDQGSANKSIKTRQFFKDIGLKLKYTEVARPTQNAYIERFFKTLKQELIYSFGVEGFSSYEKASEAIQNWVNEYNNHRPHFSLYNFTPHDIHYNIRNMSKAIDIYKQKVIDARNKRLEYWNVA